jgi:uncharacterized protein (TIGR00369 family)
MPETFGKSEAYHLLKDVFAPWVQDLGLEIVEVGENQCEFILPAGKSLVRQAGIKSENLGKPIVCGQALAAAADTASVLGLALINGAIRPNTTTDFSIRFLRPIFEGKIKILVKPLSNGKRMAVIEVAFYSQGSEKLGAHATCTFAFLD